MSQSTVFAVIGHPVKHSLSPKIHQFWFNKYRLDAVYHALDMVTESAVSDIKALVRSGYSGLNVTLPHKISAFEASMSLSDAAKKIGAVNTLIRHDQGDIRGWTGDNTDWSGFLWSLNRLSANLPERALLIGAGGAARGVAYALNQKGIALDILNRTIQKAKTLSDDLGLSASKIYTLDDLTDVSKNYRLIINTVSLGHTGAGLDLPFTDDGVFIDISYGSAADLTLKNASESGWTTSDGLPMLIGQAADAFRLWFGIDPDREAALKYISSV